MVISRTFEYHEYICIQRPLRHNGLQGPLTIVRLFETCLSSIPQMETPLISRTTFGPFLLRRSPASVSEIPFLEGKLGERKILGYGLSEDN